MELATQLQKTATRTKVEAEEPTDQFHQGNDDMANVLWSLIWLLILIFISFFVAGFCAGWYILLLPFTVCISGLTGVTDFLLKGVQFPHYCAESMVAGRGL